MTARKQPNAVRVTERGRKFMATVSWNNIRLRPTFDSQQEAEDWGKEQTIRMLRGQDIQPPAGSKNRSAGGIPATVGELYEHVRDTHWLVSGPNGGPKTSWPKLKITVEQAVKALGWNTRLSKLSIPFVEGALRDLEQVRTNSPRTTNRRMSYLMRMFAEGERIGAMDRALKLKKAPEVVDGRTFRITPVLERDMLLWAVSKKDYAFYDFLVLSLYLGQRENETLRLRIAESAARPQDGYMDGSEFAVFPRSTVRNKSKFLRAIPARPIVAEVVNRRRASATSPDQRILEGVTKDQVTHWFRSMKDEFLMRRHGEIVAQKRDGEKLGRDFCIHVMRNEFASRLGDEGFKVAEIAEYTGHSDMRVCERYIKPHKLAHRAELARNGLLAAGLPGGTVPDFAPTQPLPIVSKGHLKLVQTPPDPAALEIDPEAAVALIKALFAAGQGHLLSALVADLEKKRG